MDEKILKLKECFLELFGDPFSETFLAELIDGEYRHNIFIQVEDCEHGIDLSANREGMLYLTWRLIELCEKNKIGNHYHLDEAGMADKCNKPMAIYLAKEDW